MKARTYICLVVTVWYLSIQLPLIDASGSCWVEVFEYGWPFRTIALAKRPADPQMPVYMIWGNLELGTNILYWGILGNALVYATILCLICRVLRRAHVFSVIGSVTGIGLLGTIVLLSAWLYLYGPRTKYGLPLYLWGWPFHFSHNASLPDGFPLIANSLLMLSIPLTAAYLLTRIRQCDEPNAAGSHQ